MNTVKAMIGMRINPMKGISENMIRTEEVVVAMSLNRMLACHGYRSDNSAKSEVLW